MNQPSKHFYEFATFRVDATDRQLLRKGRVIPLKAKVFDLLLELVRNAGHVVLKEELMKEIWADTFVEEHNLAVSIYALRKALSVGAEKRMLIETIPRRGYRFTARVIETWDRPKLSNRSTIADAAIGGGQANRKSIAVLPFRLIGAISKANGYLGLGLADALITRISKLNQIVVRPTSSVRKYAGGDPDPVRMGQELSVSSVLEGSIQRSGKRMRVTVQLVNVADGATLWAEKFDETFTSIFAVEDSISEQVAGSLLTKLSTEERKQLEKRYTDSNAAYQAYQKGRFFLTKRNLKSLTRGKEYFEEAIRIDPQYALAYTGLADCYQLLTNYSAITPREAAAESKAAVLKALELDDTIAEAHVSLAYLKEFSDWDWEAAEREFRRAIEINPNNSLAHQWYSIFLRVMKRWDEAEVEIRKALELDPVSPNVNTSAASLLYFSQHYREAREQLWKTVELERNFVMAHVYLGLVNERLGLYDEAIREMQCAIRLSGGIPELHAALGYIYAVSNRRAEARTVLGKIKESSQRRYVSPYDVSLVHAGLDEKKQALDWLDRAFTERCVDLVLLMVDQRLDNLRGEPRFIDLMRRVGFTEEMCAGR